ncbi:MAG: hypothetical protein R3253_05665, partial [Longimicrobiales bacterium]|nr:hypothetical protein [Longimicrobiales bacterium]
MRTSWRRVRWIAGAVLALVAARSPGASAGFVGQADGSLGQGETPPQLREVVVRVGGARIRALCVGGAPEVFILHDEGDSADAWSSVLHRLDGQVGACVYERRGTGESVPEPGPRGWYELLDELRRVHQALGADGPYVLAGDALGGLYAWLYAGDRPGDV